MLDPSTLERRNGPEKTQPERLTSHERVAVGLVLFPPSHHEFLHAFPPFLSASFEISFQ